jgi:hypothetical protein
MLRVLTSFALVSALIWGGDGRPPRASASDYPVHQETAAATIAAVRVMPDQLNKTFPSDLAKKYIVLEVAIYPKDGATVETAMRDFVLKFGSESEAHPETAEDVAWMWRPRSSSGPDLKGNTHVTTETGVVVQSGQNPATGRKTTSVGTYEGVGVNNYPNQGSPPPATSSGIDADRMEAKLKDWALPQGKISSPAAGYLYFRQPDKKPKGALELQYAHDGSSANLTLPSK